jgi:catalase
MAVKGNAGSRPNYPSSFEPIPKPRVFAPTQEQWSGQATNFQFEVKDEDFVQATALWNVLGRQPGQQGNFVHNVASHLNTAERSVRERTYGMFSKVDKELGERIEAATEKAVSDSDTS